jgi:hypothetical protein
MIGSSIRLGACLLAAMVALALGLGAIGCGDSDSDSDQGDANASQTQAGSEPASPAEVKAATAVMPDLRKKWNSSDGQGFCDRLTPAGRREMLRYAASFKGKLKADTCGRFVTDYSGRILKAGGGHRPVRTKKIEVNGDRAKVNIMGGLAGINSTVTFKLAKDDGIWKLTNPISGGNTRRIEKN